MKGRLLSLLVLCLLLSGCGGALPPESVPPVITTTTTATTVPSPRLEEEGSRRRITGDWRCLLAPATEKEEQVDGYAILKKLRHKENQYGYVFSATLEGRLTVGEHTWYLCEIGHWVAADGDRRYEPVTWLMVPTDLSAGYAAQVGDTLTWDIADIWF